MSGMRRLINIIEAHHAYDKPTIDTKFEPFRSGDTVRVFHAFYDMGDAIKAAKIGLSGRERVGRRYSYESDNNPYGLFVSINFDAVKEFTSRGAIIEFTAKWDDLEAPVWPSGGYTVQGQMAQYFGHGANGRIARNLKRKDMTDWVKNRVAQEPEYFPHVEQSDDPHKAFTLSTPREYQALFMGHLNPDAITAFYVSNEPQKDGKYATWSRLSKEEFIARYDSEKRYHERRIFLPDEDFNGDEFIRRMSERFDHDLVINMLKSSAKEIRESQHPAQRFISYFDNYLWPKQFAPALRWLIKTYGQAPDAD